MIKEKGAVFTKKSKNSGLAERGILQKGKYPKLKAKYLPRKKKYLIRRRLLKDIRQKLLSLREISKKRKLKKKNS